MTKVWQLSQGKPPHQQAPALPIPGGKSSHHQPMYLFLETSTPKLQQDILQLFLLLEILSQQEG